MTGSDAPRPSPDEVRLNDDGTRFVLAVQGRTAFIDVRAARTGGLAMVHTEVPEALEGRGVGSALVRGALERAREAGETIHPFCPFIHAYIRRHREFADLVHPTYPRLADLRDSES